MLSKPHKRIHRIEEHSRAERFGEQRAGPPSVVPRDEEHVAGQAARQRTFRKGIP
jgi:hypothetical protein